MKLNERFIQITSVDTDENGEDTTQLTVRGTLQKNAEGQYLLQYEENFGDGLRGHSTLTVLSENAVSLVRGGSIVSELTVEKDVRHNCLYSTPMGDLYIGIYAKRVEADISDKGGTIELFYYVDANGNAVGTKKLTIQISDIIQ